jgi:hypothetical protein
MSSAHKPLQSLCAALALMGLVTLVAGCASSGQVQTSGSVYVGVGYYDSWYMGPGYYPPPGTVGPPPPRPVTPPPKPTHPIATPPSRPSPPPRPVATPRGGGGRR